MQYTCPMHPKIVLPNPGSCPICGMDLEPVLNAESDLLGDKEYHFWSVRFWVALVCTIPVVILAMGHLGFTWIQFVLTSVVVFWSGATIYVRAWKSLFGFNLNMFTLIGLGTAVAYIYSTLVFIFPNLFLGISKKYGTTDIYFEAASVIITLVLLGQMLEAQARGKTGSALKELIKQSPKVAFVVDSTGGREIPISEVKIGDKLRVLSGEKIPVDGEIIEGESHVDESMITGESNLVHKIKGDPVTGGTLNQEGSFIIVAKRVGSQTILAKIIQMVADAQRSLPPIQRVADKVAYYFVPSVIIIAIITFIFWGIWGPEPRWVHGILYSVSVLIIACPCALGLATPVSVIVGVGRAAQMGILIKNAEALEKLKEVTTLVIDKTGTLTEGLPGVTDVLTKKNVDPEMVLQLAGSVEQGSQHPISKAIIREVKDKNLILSQVSNFKTIPGLGICGEIEGQKVAVGNERMMEFMGITISEEMVSHALNLELRAKSIVYVGKEEVLGVIGVADIIKFTTPQAIADLHSMNLRIVMLTGDSHSIAKNVAGELNIDEFHARFDPLDKAKWIEGAQKGGEVVAMAGDGINDAVALAKADVGIAMGAGADVAIESAGVTLIKGNLESIKRAIHLSRATLRNIWQNLFFAFFYNSLGVPIAAGVLYPFLGITLTPMIAGIAMVASSLSVLLNALRLKSSNID